MTKKKKSKYSIIWKRLHFKYRVSAINENTLEEMWKVRTSIFSGLILVIIFATVLITFTSIIIISTPIRYYLPGYMDSEIREEALTASIKIDSLEEQVKYQQAYLNNIKRIFAGEIDVDTIKSVESFTISDQEETLQKSDREKRYTQKYEDDEKYNLSVIATQPINNSEKVLFYKPINGIIIQQYDPAKQEYGIKISTKNKEAVSAILEGTVVYTGYDSNNRYVIQIQHNNGFISIYKHNSTLLKSTGSKVKTGEAIAVIDESNNKKQDSYLYFELWDKGISVNPENYISFN